MAFLYLRSAYIGIFETETRSSRNRTISDAKLLAPKRGCLSPAIRTTTTTTTTRLEARVLRQPTCRVLVG